MLDCPLFSCYRGPCEEKVNSYIAWATLFYVLWSVFHPGIVLDGSWENKVLGRSLGSGAGLLGFEFTSHGTWKCYHLSVCLSFLSYKWPSYLPHEVIVSYYNTWKTWGTSTCYTINLQWIVAISVTTLSTESTKLTELLTWPQVSFLYVTGLGLQPRSPECSVRFFGARSPLTYLILCCEYPASFGIKRAVSCTQFEGRVYNPNRAWCSSLLSEISGDGKKPTRL